MYKIFLIKRRIDRDIIINFSLVFTWSIHYSYQLLMKLEHSRQIFEEHSNLKFYENPSTGS